MKKDKTIYYLLAVAALFYAYKYINKKKNVVIDETLIKNENSTSIDNIVETMQQLQRPEIKVIVESPETYQTFYGQMAGVKYNKVPYKC